jgi:hypothetical protein
MRGCGPKSTKRGLSDAQRGHRYPYIFMDICEYEYIHVSVPIPRRDVGSMKG